MTTMPVITSSLNYTVLLARVSADRTRSDHVKFKKTRDFETHDIMCSEKTEVARWEQKKIQASREECG